MVPVCVPLQWRHNEHDGISNPSLTSVYSTVYSRRRSKKTSKLCVTDLCKGNSPVTGKFPAQRASSAENVSIRWRHHGGPRASYLQSCRRLYSASRQLCSWSRLMGREALSIAFGCDAMWFRIYVYLYFITLTQLYTNRGNIKGVISMLE